MRRSKASTQFIHKGYVKEKSNNKESKHLVGEVVEKPLKYYRRQGRTEC